jgi:hypothetical protein
MMDRMEIGGKSVRIEANWNAITSFLKAKGDDSLKALSEIGNFTPSDLSLLMACCANEGERMDGREQCYTAEKIGEICSIAEISQFIGIYSAQTTAHVTVHDSKATDDKKKAKGPNSLG